MRIRKTVSLFITLVTAASFLGILILTENVILDNRSNKLSEKSLNFNQRNINIVSKPQNNENIDLEYNQESDLKNIEQTLISDIQVLELYKQIKFDNVDGGAWRQGWDIQIDNKRWNKQNKLKVFVVPHSHNDPGWKLTVDQYYKQFTKGILNNILAKLTEDPRRKFIWAEISYFSMWWNEISNQEKESVRRLLKQNQLEIVTGGWVMNDEANSNWLSVVHQLSEGHQWLHKNLNYTPRSHWSIDPFGLSPTQAFLLKKSGFQNMLIQRVHYAVKKQLALQTDLEFNWQQTWDHAGKTKIFTQMMPFYFYDIPHTCGPDPKICCQFDFKRFPEYKLACPWRASPKLITNENVAERAELLLDQYKKKSMLFRSNALLIPLGDDFRYSDSSECDKQFNNYQKLMDYMNQNDDMNVQIQFGTLSDYFDAVHQEMSDEYFATLSGDFFTYCDVDDHYWSGYYTSRPFYKRMDRILLYYLRGAEIIVTLTQLSRKFDLNWDDFERTLSKSRQALALFQHHDGITGTAKDHVVVDYSKRMLNSINSLQKVISGMVNILLTGNPENRETVYKIDDLWTSYDGLPQLHVIDTTNVVNFKTIVIYNSLPFERREVVTFVVTSPFLQILDEKGKVIECQISPIFREINKKLTISNTYELSFVAKVKPLGLAHYIIQTIEEIDVPRETYYSKVKLINYNENNAIGNDVVKSVFKNLKVIPQADKFSLENDHLKANFAPTGLLDSVEVGRKLTPIQLDFAKYGVRNDRVQSGAYLFLPDGLAKPLMEDGNGNVKVIIEGPILSKVHVNLSTVRHTVKIFNYLGAENLGIEIENLVDLQETSNFELAMRLTTNIKSSDEFFTDLNGYQILRRKRFSKLPLQANYYPMPSTIYIEDNKTRLTVVTSTPLGCSSLKEGQVEIMQDRRLNQDDNRGLEQGVLDNHPTRHVFRIILEERKTSDCFETADNDPQGFSTLASHMASQTLLNPLTKLIKINTNTVFTQTSSYAPLDVNFGFSYSLPILRSGIKVNDKNYVGITLHNRRLDFCFSKEHQKTPEPQKVNLRAIFSPSGSGTLIESSLTYLHLYKERNLNEDLELSPMELSTYLFPI